MTALHGHSPATSDLGELVDEKAWEHLGLTGEEFRRRWYAGHYRADLRPDVAALNHLMLTGHWDSHTRP